MNQNEKAFIKTLIKTYVERFKQEVVGENDEVLHRLARTHGSKIARVAWKQSQKWCKWSDDGPVLMPDYTRIYYRKGDTEVVLQEFPPQTRLLRFAGGTWMCPDSTEAQRRRRDIGHEVKTFSLGLPYTVFIFKFTSGHFTDVRCAFSDRPLKRLDEKPMRPYFTNLDTDLRVCLGAYDGTKLQRGQLAQQAAFILDHFWQSVFTDEWGTHFWKNREHFAQSDPRLADLQSWEDATERDPLFVVEDVEWLPLGEDNFGDMIVKNFDHAAGHNHDLNEGLYGEIVESLLNEVTKSVTDNLTKVETKLLQLDIEKEIENQQNNGGT